MKKFIAIFVAAALFATVFTACGGNDQQEPDNSSSSSSSTTPQEQDNEGDGGSEGDAGTEDNGGSEDNGGNEGDGGNEGAEESATQKIAEAIKGAYDPDTIPLVDAFPEELIDSTYGLDADTYTEVTAYASMISTYVDTVVVVKAADGKTGDVEAALKAYHDRLKTESAQYPINVAKVNAGQVVANGDYVAFIMIGAIDEREDPSDSEKAEFAEQQTQIGVDAFNAYFG